jgi:hypothetical protein
VQRVDRYNPQGHLHPTHKRFGGQKTFLVILGPDFGPDRVGRGGFDPNMDTNRALKHPKTFYDLQTVRVLDLYQPRGHFAPLAERFGSKTTEKASRQPFLSQFRSISTQSGPKKGPNSQKNS